MARTNLPPNVDSSNPTSQEFPPPMPLPAAGGEDPPWGLLHVLFVLLMAIPSYMVATLATVRIARMAGVRSLSQPVIEQNAWIAVLLQTLAYVFLVGCIVSIIYSVSQDGFWRGISWNLPGAIGSGRAMLAGAGLGFGSLVFSALLQRWIPKNLPIDQMFQNAGSAYALAGFGIFVAPPVEELFFRGLLYPALARRIGVATAVLVTALAFACLHGVQLAWAPLPVIFIFVVGLVLTLVRARTKSLAVTVLMHMAYNAAIFAVLYFSTQGFRHMERA